MNYELLKITSLTLLMGTCGVAILLAMRNGEGLSLPVERVVIAYLLITFCLPGLTALNVLGVELNTFVGSLGDKTAITKFLANALFSAGLYSAPNIQLAPTVNLPNIVGQVIRSGVWGVAASFTDLVFILAAFILEAGRDLLWQTLLVFFPIGAAFFPIAPRVPISMMLMGVELTLWLPILTIINISAGQIARQYSMRDDSIGFRVLALEIIAISLTFGIPMIASKIVSGNLSSNVMDPMKTITGLGKKLFSKSPLSSMATGAVWKLLRGRNKAVILIPLTAALLSSQAEAKEMLYLRKGFLKKVECKGRLYASGVGDDAIVDLEVLPPNLGCGVILKPLAAGSTNLILETSMGSVEKMISITSGKKQVKK